MGLHGNIRVSLQGMVANLKQIDDEGAQLSALTELCETLCISTEDSLASLPIETIVPLLVSNMHAACAIMSYNARRSCITLFG